MSQRRVKEEHNYLILVSQTRSNNYRKCCQDEETDDDMASRGKNRRNAEDGSANEWKGHEGGGEQQWEEMVRMAAGDKKQGAYYTKNSNSVACHGSVSGLVRVAASEEDKRCQRRHHQRSTACMLFRKEVLTEAFDPAPVPARMRGLATNEVTYSRGQVKPPCKMARNPGRQQR
jgi:hypothetical protein